MNDTKRSSLPPGRQPWDPANGLRIGLLVGGLLGAGVMGLTGLMNSWALLVCALIGGAIGYWSQKRA